MYSRSLVKALCSRSRYLLIERMSEQSNVLRNLRFLPVEVILAYQRSDIQLLELLRAKRALNFQFLCLDSGVKMLAKAFKANGRLMFTCSGDFCGWEFLSCNIFKADFAILTFLLYSELLVLFFDFCFDTLSCCSQYL